MADLLTSTLVGNTAHVAALLTVIPELHDWELVRQDFLECGLIEGRQHPNGDADISMIHNIKTNEYLRSCHPYDMIPFEMPVNCISR